MALVNGTNVVLYEGDVALGHSKSATMSLQMDMAEFTNKDSQGWKEVLAGKRSASFTADGLIDYSDAMNYNQFVDRIITRAQVQWVFQTAGMFYYGLGYIQNVEQVSQMENVSTYSVDFKISGHIYTDTRLIWNQVFTNWENLNIQWQNV
jgi:predicted secreted protein